LKKENSLPAFPYVPAIANRPPGRSRKLLTRGAAVIGFLVALLIAAMLRGV
jgi:hypothetical protein